MLPEQTLLTARSGLGGAAFQGVLRTRLDKMLPGLSPAPATEPLLACARLVHPSMPQFLQL